MKSLHDTLQRLFGASPDATPAVPSSLREAPSAESAARSCYDYPRVPSIDDLPPDPDSSAEAPQGDSVVSRCDTGGEGAYGNFEPECECVKEAAGDYQPVSPGSGKRFQVCGKLPEAACQQSGIDDLLSGLETCDPRAFSKRLRQGVREVHGGNPVAFYTAAGISRSAYSRLISHPDRHPSKDTVLAMAVALHMSLPDAENFLRLAGYALSPHIPADLVWRRCFQTGIHDLSFIREALVTRLPGHSG